MKSVLMRVKILMLVLLYSTITNAGNSDYKIIANKRAGITSLTRSELRAIFQGKKQAWDNGKKITLVNFAAGSDVQKSFSSDVLGMTGTQLKKFYLKEVFRGSMSAVPEVAEDTEDVHDLVDESKGAIGYIAANADIGEHVEVTIK